MSNRALSMRLGAVERREADRTLVKPEPNPMCDTSRLAASAAEEARAERESRARDAEGVLEAASQMAHGSPGHLQMREECAINPGVIERLNKALNGEFSPYLPEAPSYPVMLVLSEVVKLRKHIEAQDRLVRFLVERSGGLR